MREETILIVDDEHLIRWSLNKELEKKGFRILEADTIKNAIKSIDENKPDLVILDQKLPDGRGTEILEKLSRENSDTTVVMLTSVDDAKTAVEALKLGALDYIGKPIDHDELMKAIEHSLESTALRRTIAKGLRKQESKYGFIGMIGQSNKMKETFQLISKIAASYSTTVLITGESGTGKELAAKAIHSLSDRNDKPFVTINCSALPETLIETELFGHEKGAYTDAKTQRKGVFEIADGGVIFLDEIGDISQVTQVKLLRIIEEKTFRRVGGDLLIKVDVRILAATNRPVEELVSEGKFRSDLYYRLNVAGIVLPPLRDRGDDIVFLAKYFLNEFNTKFGKNFQGFSDDVVELLHDYDWPGNVRELKNCIERAVLLHDGQILNTDCFQLDRRTVSSGSTGDKTVGVGTDGMSLKEIEKNLISSALEKCGNNQSKAARMLKISRDTMRYRMKKYNLL